MSTPSPTRSTSNRREFLKTGSTVVAGGLATSMVGPQLAFSRSVHAAGSDTIRIGLIGCGGRGTGAAIEAMNTTSGEVRLAAVADVFQDRLDGAVNGISRAHEGRVDVQDGQRFLGLDAYRRVLESDVDLVVLATPPGFRPLHLEAAIAAGKHVFMEKPVAVDAPGVRRVLAASDAARQKGLAVAVGLQRRHEPAYREIIKRLQDGEIGDIVLGRAYWNGATPWVRPRQSGQTELEYQMRNWYFFNWICGDHIVEQHIHNIDVINWLKDAYPVKAQGQGGRQVRTGKDHGQIFDHHFVEFTYEDGTIMHSQCRQIQGCTTDVSEHAHGTSGYADISGGVIQKHGGETWRTNGTRGGHQQEHHDLFADLRAGRIPNEGHYGALSTMTAILGRMATYTGVEIPWEEAFQSDLQLADVDKLVEMDDPAPVKPDAQGRYPIPVPGDEASRRDVL